jgi:small subunit ribosomal protein S5
MAEEVKQQEQKAPVSDDKKSVGNKQTHGDRKNDGGKKPARRGRARKEAPEREFDQNIIDLARVTRVMAGGKRMRFRATVVIGDRKGRVGIGVGKALDVSEAINKAVNSAKKELIQIPLYENTLPHQISVKLGAAKVLLKPASDGTGIIAGGAVRSVLDLGGVPNVAAKMLGSRNKLNNARATIIALRSLHPRKSVKK